MKKILLFVVAIMLIFTSAHAECGCSCGEALDGTAHDVFETVKQCAWVPKDAQVVSAMEYMCKIEDQQLRLVLIHTTQDENIEMMFGFSSRIIIVDMDTGDAYGYANLAYPESSDVASKEDALKVVYGGYDSWVQGINEYVWADHEMTFPLSEEDIAAINGALNAHFGY